MLETRATRAAELLKSALEHDPREWPSFLDEACGSDSGLRVEVESLLQFQQPARGFMQEPAIHLAADVFLDRELKPEETIGDYKIISLIGSGGMGDVYLAEDRQLHRQVALKIVRRGTNTDEVVRRFQREEQILASLNHPNIARLYGGAITSDGVPFFVMEYVDGTRLDDFCDENRLPLNERLALFRKVCGAVAYAHQHLVIHRDIKPSNIRVTAEGEPKLLDFGIAKLLDATSPIAEQTMTFPGAMTPEYASPEQLRGEAMTTTSDVYSLGVVLYKILTGQSPYRTRTNRPDEIVRAITEQEPTRPSTALLRRGSDSNHELPFTIHDSRFLRGDLDNIVLKALRKDQQRRYASAAQLSADIQRHLDGLPVIARKDTFDYRSSKFIRRHKVGVAAAALVALALIAGIIATSWQARLARAERDHARLAQIQAERLNEFLQSLLGSADPDGMGRDVKVVDVLDSAAKKIDAELVDQPEILAQAHLTMSRAYAHLRQAAPTEEHARQALAIDQQIYRNAHPATAQVMAFLGYALRVFRRFDEAEPLLRQALAVQRRYPPAQKEFVGTLIDLGTVLTERGRAKEATLLIDEALELDRRTYGEQSAEYADALNVLGNLRLGMGAREGAKAAYHHSIDIHRKLHPGRFSMVNPLENLVCLLIQERNLKEAESLLQEAEARCRETVGEANPTYGNIRGIFGYLSFLKKDYHAAAPELQKVVDGLTPVYPVSDANVVAAEILLGLSLTRDGRAAEGERYLRAAFQSGTKGSVSESFGPVEDLAGPLGECLLAQERYAEAAPLLQASYNALRTSRGELDAMTIEAKQRLLGLQAAR